MNVKQSLWEICVLVAIAGTVRRGGTIAGLRAFHHVDHGRAGGPEGDRKRRSPSGGPPTGTPTGV